jgi:hypothetical protein
MTPTLDQFPIPARPISPFSDISQSSRSSTPTSDSDSYSCPDHTFDVGFELTPTTEQLKDVKLSHREPARPARVFVDTTRTTVTPYDGGKTTVLTGGVMLGGAPKLRNINAARVARAPTHGWRFNVL